MKEDFKLKPYSNFEFFKKYFKLVSIIGSITIAVIEYIVLFFMHNLNLKGLGFILLSVISYIFICLFYYIFKKIKYEKIEYIFSKDKFIYNNLFKLKRNIAYKDIAKAEVVQSEYQDKYDIGDIVLLNNKNKKIICLNNVEDVFDNVVKIMDKIS